MKKPKPYNPRKYRNPKQRLEDKYLNKQTAIQFLFFIVTCLLFGGLTLYLLIGLVS